MQICRKCGTRLDSIEEGQQYHPLCYPEWEKLPGTAMSVGEMEVREDLLEMIQWGSANTVRSKQVALGCSEAGQECDRRIAYKMAGSKQVNFPDPLKANMGTAFHVWLDDRMRKFQAAEGMDRWITETEVYPASFMKGHVDLYDKHRFLVLDWKTTSADMIKKWKTEGVPQQYKVQVMLYGKGMINLGYRVDRVGLIGINRSGALRDIVVLTLPYDDDFAVSALRRIWKIGKQLNGMGENPDFAQIGSAPDLRMCGYCPQYRGGARPADDTGCPGRTTGDPIRDLFQ